jgi:hypothetical protein
MHDFGEGMIRFVIKNDDIAFALISPKFWIEACLLNSRIERFQYSFMISLTNHPQIFQTKKSDKRETIQHTREVGKISAFWIFIWC